MAKKKKNVPREKPKAVKGKEGSSQDLNQLMLKEDLLLEQSFRGVSEAMAFG